VDNQMKGSAVEPAAPRYRFGPDRRLTAVSGVVSLVAALAAALSSDSAGQVLLVGVAVVLFAYTATDLMFWPRLTVTAAGLRIHTPMARAQLSWPEVAAVRADARQRLGLRSVTLEIDAGEQLVVFSRRALGTDPEAAAELIRAFDPHS
jgi:hypothetical protein